MKNDTTPVDLERIANVSHEAYETLFIFEVVIFDKCGKGCEGAEKSKNILCIDFYLYKKYLIFVIFK